MDRGLQRRREEAAGRGIAILELLDELRVIAQNGIEYSDGPQNAYDRQRYERVLELVTDYYGRALDAPPTAVRESLRGEVGHVSAKVGAVGAVFDDEGNVLTMERAESGQWALPGGYVDPNESAEEAVVREIREETGLDVEPVELVDVYSLAPGEEGNPHSIVNVVYRCRVRGGELRLSHEGTDLTHRDPKRLPAEAWHEQNRRYALDAAPSAGSDDPRR
ncbi:Hydrolase of X-linked nucleoside diphosphate N terminal [Halopelagius inordinatus]|uniref:Hydrolase of X-linked nucleoside diphosphate N terminal n=1 Tax=Halopelagius inordinatus TaxID=553467 RepID=A0A1I2RYR1_9EURY|nr:NUDIX hydrolase N-terminal domain-containing protein [Halopelagius inordinatus]SFG43757.1 Hydrolase of X-linked nucleoside diphosphate N terminal [Halopelagius inordinatus]